MDLEEVGAVMDLEEVGAMDLEVVGVGAEEAGNALVEEDSTRNYHSFRPLRSMRSNRSPCCSKGSVAGGASAELLTSRG